MFIKKFSLFFILFLYGLLPLDALAPSSQARDVALVAQAAAWMKVCQQVPRSGAVVRVQGEGLEELLQIVEALLRGDSVEWLRKPNTPYVDLTRGAALAPAVLKRLQALKYFDPNNPLVQNDLHLIVRSIAHYASGYRGISLVEKDLLAKPASRPAPPSRSTAGRRGSTLGRGAAGFGLGLGFGDYGRREDPRLQAIVEGSSYRQMYKDVYAFRAKSGVDVEYSVIRVGLQGVYETLVMPSSYQHIEGDGGCGFNAVGYGFLWTLVHEEAYAHQLDASRLEEAAPANPLTDFLTLLNNLWGAQFASFVQLRQYLLLPGHVDWSRKTIAGAEGVRVKLDVLMGRTVRAYYVDRLRKNALARRELFNYVLGAYRAYIGERGNWETFNGEPGGFFMKANLASQFALVDPVALVDLAKREEGLNHIVDQYLADLARPYAFAANLDLDTVAYFLQLDFYTLLTSSTLPLSELAPIFSALHSDHQDLDTLLTSTLQPRYQIWERPETLERDLGKVGGMTLSEDMIAKMGVSEDQAKAYYARRLKAKAWDSSFSRLGCKRILASEEEDYLIVAQALSRKEISEEQADYYRQKIRVNVLFLLLRNHGVLDIQSKINTYALKNLIHLELSGLITTAEREGLEACLARALHTYSAQSFTASTTVRELAVHYRPVILLASGGHYDIMRRDYDRLPVLDDAELRLPAPTKLAQVTAPARLSGSLGSLASASRRPAPARPVGLASTSSSRLPASSFAPGAKAAAPARKGPPPVRPPASSARFRPAGGTAGLPQPPRGKHYSPEPLAKAVLEGRSALPRVKESDAGAFLDWLFAEAQAVKEFLRFEDDVVIDLVEEQDALFKNAVSQGVLHISVHRALLDKWFLPASEAEMKLHRAALGAYVRFSLMHELSTQGLRRFSPQELLESDFGGAYTPAALEAQVAELAIRNRDIRLYLEFMGEQDDRLAELIWGYRILYGDFDRIPVLREEDGFRRDKVLESYEFALAMEQESAYRDFDSRDRANLLTCAAA